MSESYEAATEVREAIGVLASEVEALRGTIEQMTIAHIAGQLLKFDQASSMFIAVKLAREIVETVYKTEPE